MGPSSAGDGSGAGADVPAADKLPHEMSKSELQAAIKEVGEKLKKDERRLRNNQLSGRFDVSLLNRVNKGRESLAELEAELAGR